MNRLQGGPFYELSFLIKNQVDKESLVKQVFFDLSKKRNFKIHHTKEELAERVQLFVEGENEDNYPLRSLDIDAQIDISGSRKLRLFIAELSDELLKINFWFFGSLYDANEWNQIGLKESDKPEFRLFFEEAKEILEPILGTIAYEEDCSVLFDSEYTYPNKYYKIENLTLEKIKERIYRIVNEFEYCWINGNALNLEQDIDFEIRTA